MIRRLMIPLHPSFPGTGPSAVVREGLRTLFAARQYAAQAGRTVWEFAVELRVFTGLGLTSNDLRWLLHQGYVQHARETTKPGSACREFEHIANFMLPEGTCFVLTDPGYEQLAQAFGPGWAGAAGGPAPAAEDLKLRPAWDGVARELYVGGLIVKRFKQPAPVRKPSSAPSRKTAGPSASTTRCRRYPTATPSGTCTTPSITSTDTSSTRCSAFSATARARGFAGSCAAACPASLHQGYTKATPETRYE